MVLTVAEVVALSYYGGLRSRGPRYGGARGGRPHRRRRARPRPVPASSRLAGRLRRSRGRRCGVRGIRLVVVDARSARRWWWPWITAGCSSDRLSAHPVHPRRARRLLEVAGAVPIEAARGRHPTAKGSHRVRRRSRAKGSHVIGPKDKRRAATRRRRRHGRTAGSDGCVTVENEHAGGLRPARPYRVSPPRQSPPARRAPRGPRPRYPTRKEPSLQPIPQVTASRTTAVTTTMTRRGGPARSPVSDAREDTSMVAARPAPTKTATSSSGAGPAGA